MCVVHSVFFVFQKGSLHARPRVFSSRSVRLNLDELHHQLHAVFSSLAFSPARAEELATIPWRGSKAEILRCFSSMPHSRVQEFTHKGKGIIVVQMDYASGVDSSWLYVFAQGRDDWFRALSWIPIGGDSFRVVQHGDRVTFGLAAMKMHVLDLSISGACTEPQKSK